jgi:hypothetical protein
VRGTRAKFLRVLAKRSARMGFPEGLSDVPLYVVSPKHHTLTLAVNCVRYYTQRLKRQLQRSHTL